MTGYLFAIALCLILIAFLVHLLRTRRLREKYAGLWIVVSLAVAVIAAFPGIPVRLATLVGVELPVNLLFAVALLVLLVVCIQLSIGVSSLDERVRTLTEELALLRLEAVPEEVTTAEGDEPSQRGGPGEHRP
ncbi:DUF2304 domain-containing protein [Serinibacter arcticus]|uniref:Putative integral membrane protein n=1 Tax=Serinibacter arcticus TaxID=1655435 RepID=A0A4Z1DWY4_9MICO|nr:DUF2304 domain-containing protein [Serinibacter arcticus]TGO04086.1 putative integral membrane protein [Serinibacter arcticus]